MGVFKSATSTSLSFIKYLRVTNEETKLNDKNSKLVKRRRDRVKRKER